MNMTYLDNAATTKVCPEAVEAAVEAMTSVFANPSSTHAPGRAARTALKKARAAIAGAMGAQPEEIFFTSGGTEGDNWAIRSACYHMRRQGRHIISSAAEHDAVLKTLEQMKKEGWSVTLLSPDKTTGKIRTEDVIAALQPDTVLVSLMLVNNETGAINDIAEISRALRGRGAQTLIHTDAVQGFMKIPFNTEELGADMITVSAHKNHAPKGTGALYVRQTLRLPPLIFGGGQENGRRSGTENLPGICAFAAAVSAAAADRDTFTRMQKLRTQALTEMRRIFPDLTENGAGAPHILNISLPGYKSEVMMNYLDSKEICLSRGSACKKGARSHVLRSMGLSPERIDSSLRISMSRFTNEEDIKRLCLALTEAERTLIRL